MSPFIEEPFMADTDSLFTGARATRAPLLHALRASVLLTLLGCPQETAIWIIPGSSAQHLEFGISDERDGTSSVPWGGLVVYRCEADNQPAPAGAVWMMCRAICGR